MIDQILPRRPDPDHADPAGRYRRAGQPGRRHREHRARGQDAGRRLRRHRRLGYRVGCWRWSRAALIGMVVGLLMSLAVTRLDANMIIAGLGLNVPVAGLVGFILSVAFGSSGTLRLPDVALLPRLRLPGGGGAGPRRILARLDPLTVFAWASVAGVVPARAPGSASAPRDGRRAGGALGRAASR